MTRCPRRDTFSARKRSSSAPVSLRVSPRRPAEHRSPSSGMRAVGCLVHPKSIVLRLDMDDHCSNTGFDCIVRSHQVGGVDSRKAKTLVAEAGRHHTTCLDESRDYAALFTLWKVMLGHQNLVCRPTMWMRVECPGLQRLCHCKQRSAMHNKRTERCETHVRVCSTRSSKLRCRIFTITYSITVCEMPG